MANNVQDNSHNFVYLDNDKTRPLFEVGLSKYQLEQVRQIVQEELSKMLDTALSKKESNGGSE